MRDRLLVTMWLCHVLLSRISPPRQLAVLVFESLIALIAIRVNTLQLVTDLLLLLSCIVGDE
jgi:hypothetical protein